MRKYLSAVACLGVLLVTSIPADAAWNDWIKKGKEAVNEEIDKAKESITKGEAGSGSEYNSDQAMVREAQAELKRLGYSVSVDGLYGPGTKNAIARFQVNEGMKKTGDVSPKLIKKLKKTPTPGAAVAQNTGELDTLAAYKTNTSPAGVAANTSKPVNSSSGSSMQTSSAAGKSAPAAIDSNSLVNTAKLFKLYMASQGDILNVPVVANTYYYKFEIPPGTGTNNYNYKASEECTAYQQKWQKADEFERVDLIKSQAATFGAALQKAKSWPKSATYTIIGTGTLGNYDMKAEKFPLTIRLDQFLPQNQIFEPGECRIPHLPNQNNELNKGRHLLPSFRFESVDVSDISDLAMSRDRAKSYLNAHKVDHKGNPDPNAQPDRSVKFEAQAEFGPITIKGGLLQPVPVRVLSAKVIDRLTGETLRTLKTESSSDSASTATLDPENSMPANRESLALIALKDHPDLLTDEVALKLTERQIVAEQSLWSRIDNYLNTCKMSAGNCQSLNKKNPAFIYEWQSLEKSRPNLANGPVLDLYRNPNASMSFVKRDKAWDDRFQAVVAVFVFSRDAVVGRDPKFVARELVTVWKRHLAAVLKKVPSQLHISTQIVDAAYDFDRQSVEISPAYKGKISSPNYQRQDSPDLFKPYLEPSFEAPELKKWPSSGAFIFPGSVRNALLYRPEVVRSNQTKNKQHMSAARNDEKYGATFWRDALSHQVHVIWLALDRRLSLASLKMDPSAGERFVNQFRASGLEVRVTFEAVRADLGRLVYRNKQPEVKAPIVIGRVQNISLMNREKKVLSSFKPSDFPSASSVAAAADKAKQEAAASAKSAELKAAEEKQQQRDSLLSKCQAEGSELLRLKCRNDVCRNNQTLFDRETCQSIGQQFSELSRADRYCRNKFEFLANTLDTPKPGSAPFESAVSSCLADPAREVYGPDVVGLRLGMPINEADNAARKRFSEGYMNARHNRPYPFDSSSLMWDRKAANQGIALFALQSQGNQYLAGISRRLYFGEDGPKKSGIVKGLRDKYGEEASSSGNTLVWAFPPEGSKLTDKSKCAPLAKMVKARTGWESKWQPPIDHAALQAKIQSKSNEARAKLNACSLRVQKIYTEKFEDASESKINKLSIEMQEDLTECQQEYSAATSNLSTAQADDREVRSPLMIEGGNRKGYRSYRSCGPILVTKFNPRKNGQLKDASFVLFDPGWVGRQPGFMFQSPKKPEKKSGGQGGAIDF